MATVASVDLVRLHPNDNIAVAGRAIPAGTTLEIGGRALEVTSDIRMGHKVALRPIARRERVLKYGQPIGLATRDIESGQWVHTHNLVNGDFGLDYAIGSAIPGAPEPLRDQTFLGYRRRSGKTGTRNYIAVVSTVNCSASVSRFVADRFDRSALERYPNIDGVVAFTHGGGCGMEFAGLQHEMLNRVLGGIARHPNIGAFLLVGLGCEQGAMGYLVGSQRLVQIDGVPADRDDLPVFSIQDCGGTVKTVEAAGARLAELLPRANAVRREPSPASELIVGTECGGSDGYSGITANPAVGVASDLIVAAGGTAVLAETTEIYGAEHLLTRRARSPEVAHKLIDRINWWKWYAGLLSSGLDNNPSVGNKEGGLTTIAEKSLGAVAKGGSTALENVYQYAEPIESKGLVVMDTPGFDPPSVTGMVAGGANVIVFTTGRGSCFGSKPVPSIKIATNTPLFERLGDDMDLDAGTVMSGETVEQAGRRIFDEILAVASGKRTRSEIHGIGDQEFVPWQVGPTL